MTILHLPAEIVALLVELLDVESIFNLGLTCRLLSHILFDDRICRLALRKARFSAEASEAQATRDFARGFRRLAKRRIAVRAAQPWTVAIVAMADRFSYTNGVLCYTVNNEQLRVLRAYQALAAELTVDVPLLLKLALRDFDPSSPYTFAPLYYAEGILSCVFTRGREGAASSWLIVFELRDTPRWVSVKRLCPEYEFFVRNDEEYLFCGTRSHARLDGSHRWGLHRLDLRSRQWSDPQLVLWEFDGSSLGMDICFEIIDGYFYCVSNTMKTQTDHRIRNYYYQAVRFPVKEATHESCEKPLLHNLWRRHGSEGAVDERWTSLQLVKDEDSGKLLIVETRREWFPENSGSQRTCYKKELRFGRDGEMSHQPPPGSFLLTPPQSAQSSPTEREWDSERHVEVRPDESIHVGDNPTDITTYTLQECFVRSYNPSCGSFVDLVCEAYSPDAFLQLRVRPKLRTIHQDSHQPRSIQRRRKQPAEFWPRDRSMHQHDNTFAQLSDIVHPVKPLKGLEWGMDERILVYSPTHMAPDQLRPIVLLSFDPALRFPGLPKLRHSSAGSSGRPESALPDAPPPSQEPAWGISETMVLPPTCQDRGSSTKRNDEVSSSDVVKPHPPLYQTMSMGNGAPHGFDMSYHSWPGSELLR